MNLARPCIVDSSPAYSPNQGCYSTQLSPGPWTTKHGRVTIMRHSTNKPKDECQTSGHFVRPLSDIGVKSILARWLMKLAMLLISIAVRLDPSTFNARAALHRFMQV